MNLTKEYLYEHYIKQNKSIRKIAAELDTSVYIIRRNLTKHGFSIISSSERLTKKLNESFFDTLTSKSAFLLGYIMTDGDLLFNHKNQKYFLRIYSKYKNQIELVQKLLEMEGIIQFRKETNHTGKKQGAIYFIHIANQRIIENLMSYGMIPRKNDKIEFPKIHDELLPYFLRGCFMGSGSFYITNKGQIHISFTIGSKSFISSLNNTLCRKGLTFRNIYENKTKKPSFYFRYAENDSLALIEYIYKSDYELLKCERQVDKIKEYLSIDKDTYILHF